jgi:hypothetical protein
MASFVDIVKPIINPLQPRSTSLIINPSLRVLSLKFWDRSRDYKMNPNRHVDVDLRPIPSLKLPSLTRVDIETVFGPKRVGDEAVKPKLREAMKALGLGLLGGSARMELHEETRVTSYVWTYTFFKTL